LQVFSAKFPSIRHRFTRERSLVRNQPCPCAHPDFQGFLAVALGQDCVSHSLAQSVAQPVVGGPANMALSPTKVPRSRQLVPRSSGARGALSGSLSEVPIDDEREVPPARGLGIEVEAQLDPAHDQVELSVVDAVHNDHAGV